jgi:hypothetical protein
MSEKTQAAAQTMQSAAAPRTDFSINFIICRFELTTDASQELTNSSRCIYLPSNSPAQDTKHGQYAANHFSIIPGPQPCPDRRR